MNDESTSTLREAASRLEPDIERLVAGGTARGRRLRRRRRVTTSLAAVAAVGVVAVSVPLLNSGGAGPTGAEIASDPTPSVSETTPPAAPARRELAVTQAQVPGTFGELFEGEITALPQKEVVDSAPIVDFLWDGFGVRVGITPAEYALPYDIETGEQIGEAGTPRERCQGGGIGNCVAGPDGSFVATYENTGPAVDGGVSSRFVTVYAADGWDVTLVSHNAADSKGSPLLADEPPFTLAQLRQAALSDIWFQ